MKYYIALDILGNSLRHLGVDQEEDKGDTLDGLCQEKQLSLQGLCLCVSVLDLDLILLARWVGRDDWVRCEELKVGGQEGPKREQVLLHSREDKIRDFRVNKTTNDVGDLENLALPDGSEKASQVKAQCCVSIGVLSNTALGDWATKF